VPKKGFERGEMRRGGWMVLGHGEALLARSVVTLNLL
jgi:hypothetical protein